MAADAGKPQIAYETMLSPVPVNNESDGQDICNEAIAEKTWIIITVSGIPSRSTLSFYTPCILRSCVSYTLAVRTPSLLDSNTGVRRTKAMVACALSLRFQVGWEEEPCVGNTAGVKASLDRHTRYQEEPGGIEAWEVVVGCMGARKGPFLLGRRH